MENYNVELHACGCTAYTSVAPVCTFMYVHACMCYTPPTCTLTCCASRPHTSSQQNKQANQTRGNIHTCTLAISPRSMQASAAHAHMHNSRSKLNDAAIICAHQPNGVTTSTPAQLHIALVTRDDQGAQPVQHSIPLLPQKRRQGQRPTPHKHRTN